MKSEEYNFPVWGTQGGGLVRQVENTYIFVETPNCPGLKVDDEVPDQWGLIPANKLAHALMEKDEDEFVDV